MALVDLLPAVGIVVLRGATGRRLVGLDPGDSGHLVVGGRKDVIIPRGALEGSAAKKLLVKARDKIATRELTDL